MVAALSEWRLFASKSVELEGGSSITAGIRRMCGHDMPGELAEEGVARGRRPAEPSYAAKGEHRRGSAYGVRPDWSREYSACLDSREGLELTSCMSTQIPVYTHRFPVRGQVAHDSKCLIN